VLRLRELTLELGAFRLGPVSLEAPQGEYFVLMGATGSGKSLLVKCIAGLVRRGGGRIILAGRDVTCAEPRDRRVGYVPQGSGLFPHLDVRENLTFGLRARGASRRAARGRIEPIVEALGIAGLLERRVATLSGGETQKVALGRALAARPDVLLLDEPVSALDEPTRRETCALLRAVQRDFGVATIHVCHSASEAEAVADRVGVLDAGRLLQTGPLAALRAEPDAPAVRRLLGPTGADPDAAD
jgi:ABC-type sugar transport system ATPase subunit